MHLLSLPGDVLGKILSYISFDEVSRARLVCSTFNEISMTVLNHGFHKVEKYHTQCLKRVKSQLPRRESERRNHPLARHCDILTAVETRLSLLGMTFNKFIDLNICCFIPGKVLDELFKVLRYVTTEQSPVRAHEVMQELRDLSSMAMEYFDEKIAPALKQYREAGPKINVIYTAIKHPRPSEICNPKENRMCKDHEILDKLTKGQNYLLTEVIALKKRELKSIRKRVTDLEQFAADTKKKMVDSEELVQKQQITITQLIAQLKDQGLQIKKLGKLIKGKKLKKCTGESSSKTHRANRKEKPQVIRIERACITQRSSKKRKFPSNLTDKKDENVQKKVKQQN